MRQVGIKNNIKYKDHVETGDLGNRTSTNKE